jgi:uncharacterized protein YkwD
MEGGWRVLLGKALAVALFGLVALNVFGVGPSILSVRPAGAGEYRYHAEWADYLAPDSACPNAEDSAAAIEAQQQTMLCLLNWARTRRGLGPLRTEPALMRAAARKAADIVRCQDFAHAACGAAPDAHARAAGHDSSFGENIAWSTGPARAPKATLDGWLDSDGHRRNLFRSDWAAHGIGLVHGTFDGKRDAAVWVSQFGD